jgi:hypothetical protein
LVGTGRVVVVGRIYIDTRDWLVGTSLSYAGSYGVQCTNVALGEISSSSMAVVM